MKISCPICGKRPLEEFSYKGDATVKRPHNWSRDNQSEWVDYVYFRDNPKGWHQEYWHHAGGCRAWLKVERHTVSHQIKSVELASNSNGSSV